MAAIITSKRRQSQIPSDTSAVAIDWANDLAKAGLVSLILPRNTANRFYASPSLVSTRYGNGVACGGGFIWQRTPTFGSEASIFMLGGLGQDISGAALPASIGTTTSGGNQLFALQGFASVSLPARAIIRTSNGGVISTAELAGSGDGVIYPDNTSWLAVYDGTASLGLYRNGVNAVASRANTAASGALSSMDNIALGGVMRGTPTIAGGGSRQYLGMAFNQALKAEHAKELQRNPWQVLRPAQRCIFVPVSGGSPVTHDLSASALAQAAATAALDVQAGGVAVDLAAAGAAQAASSAQLLKGVSLASAGLAVASGGASMSHVVPLSGAAVAVVQAGADLSLAVTLAASALIRAAGAANLSTSAGADLDAAGAAQAAASATLSLVVNLSAAAVGQALATAAMAHGVPLAAAGAGQAGGAAALQAGSGADLAAAGIAQASAGAALWLDVPLSAAALAQAVAGGSLTLAVPLRADALAQAGGTAVLAGAVTLHAGGQVVATAAASLLVMGPLSQYDKGKTVKPDRRSWRAPADARGWKVLAEQRSWRAEWIH